jgi:hypothetical protein
MEERAIPIRSLLLCHCGGAICTNSSALGIWLLFDFGREFNKSPDCLGARWEVGLAAAPVVYHSQKLLRCPHLKQNDLEAACRADLPRPAAQLTCAPGCQSRMSFLDQPRVVTSTGLQGTISPSRAAPSIGQHVRRDFAIRSSWWRILNVFRNTWRHTYRFFPVALAVLP